MKSIAHPPDAVLRAYSDLVKQVFLYFRNSAQELDRKQLYDLSDAMHNIDAILADYGTWTDDEKYRAHYLRRFDAEWGNRGIRLEEFLETRLQEYSET